MRKPILPIVFDTETTGVDVTSDTIVQMAAVMAIKGKDGLRPVTLFSSYANPGREIPAEASEVHGIFAKDLIYSPSANVVLDTFNHLLTTLSHDYQIIMVGHNSDKFDMPLICNLRPKCNFNRFPHIDTYTLAIRTMPSDVQKLGPLFSHITGKPEVNAHDAAADCFMVIPILEQMIRNTGKSLEELAEWCSKSIVLDYMPYGKHKGLPMSEVPKSYLNYAKRTWDDTNKDVWATILHYTNG